MYDMQRITELAHKKGALVLWDFSHSVGSVPVHLDDCNADFAIGCTYKYLNGGPGAPAFLYVNKNIQEKLSSPIWGWWGQKNPFDFDLDYTPAPGAQRFMVGTQPMISLLTMEAALEPMLQAGMDSLREKSILMTDFASFLTESWLVPFGFSLGSPLDSAMRGSHISIRHPEGYRINRALIEEMNVIPDFRAPDNLAPRLCAALSLLCRCMGRFRQNPPRDGRETLREVPDAEVGGNVSMRRPCVNRGFHVQR
jgi:kynureninase